MFIIVIPKGFRWDLKSSKYVGPFKNKGQAAQWIYDTFPFRITREMMIKQIKPLSGAWS